VVWLCEAVRRNSRNQAFTDYDDLLRLPAFLNHRLCVCMSQVTPYKDLSSWIVHVPSIYTLTIKQGILKLGVYLLSSIFSGYSNLAVVQTRNSLLVFPAVDRVIRTH